MLEPFPATQPVTHPYHRHPLHPELTARPSTGRIVPVATALWLPLDKISTTATKIQNAINGNVGGMGTTAMKSLTSTQVQAIATALASQTPPPPPPLRPQQMVPPSIPELRKLPRLSGFVQQDRHHRYKIQTPSTVTPGNGHPVMKSLTSTQVQAIATRSLGRHPSPTAPPSTTDGPTLYAQSCTSCHGSLASSNKIGTTAAVFKAPLTETPGEWAPCQTSPPHRSRLLPMRSLGRRLATPR